MFMVTVASLLRILVEACSQRAPPIPAVVFLFLAGWRARAMTFICIVKNKKKRVSIYRAPRYRGPLYIGALIHRAPIHRAVYKGGFLYIYIWGFYI